MRCLQFVPGVLPQSGRDGAPELIVDLGQRLFAFFEMRPVNLQFGGEKFFPFVVFALRNFALEL